MAHVLVVDDDPVVHRIVRDQLEFDGHRTYPATDWTSMNAVLFERTVHVVLMDVQLPGLDGDTLTDILRRNLETPPEVILHSSLDEATLAARARQVGAQAHLSKGAPLAVIRQAVQEAVRAYEARTGRDTGSGSRPGIPRRG